MYRYSMEFCHKQFDQILSVSAIYDNENSPNIAKVGSKFAQN